MNEARVQGTTCGKQVMAPVPPLVLEAKLQRAATAHSLDMAVHRKMNHVGSDGSNPPDRVNREGYSWSTVGENIAYGYSTTADVMAGWLRSEGHCKNIMNPNFTELGAANVDNYWTQVFARPL